MPSIAGWLGSSDIRDAINDEGMRAVAAWGRINDRPSSITLYRDRVVLPTGAQTVRLEYSEATTSAQKEGKAGMPSERQLIVFGVRDHPTVSNTDIERGDRFKHGGDWYSVVDVIRLPGEVQAYTERLQSGG